MKNLPSSGGGGGSTPGQGTKIPHARGQRIWRTTTREGYMTQRRPKTAGRDRTARQPSRRERSKARTEGSEAADFQLVASDPQT